MTPSQRVARIESEAVGRDLNSWEKHNFLPSIKQRATLSEKHEKELAQIEQRLFEDEDENT